MYTSPGYIPDDPKWQDGDIKLPPEHEQKIKTLVNNQNSSGLNGMSPWEYVKQYLLNHPTLSPSEGEDTTSFLESWLQFLRHFPLIERKFPKPATKDQPREEGGRIRICRKCNVFKPDRSHHCKHCNKCVLRMDHHCPWIRNCVGFFNYKFFCLVVLYGALSSGIVAVYSLPRLMACFQPMLDPVFFFSRDLAVIVATVASANCALVLAGFLGLHLIMSANAMTTIEFEEKRGSRSKLAVHRFAVAHIKYDLGAFNNLCHVFGPIYTWLLPISPYSAQEDGCYWKPVDTSLCC